MFFCKRRPTEPDSRVEDTKKLTSAMIEEVSEVKSKLSSEQSLNHKLIETIAGLHAEIHELANQNKSLEQDVANLREDNEILHEIVQQIKDDERTGHDVKRVSDDNLD
jgi:FtsZ-binding cell division protein ZapB